MMLVLGISACSPDAAIQSPLEQPLAARSTGEVVDRAQDLDQLAQSIALSLESKAARHRLLASWRGSRESSDHKLSIRRYLHSSDGFELLSELAVTRRSDAAAVATLVDNLPELDFYVPFGEHRRTWRGTDDVLVAVAVDFDAPEIQAYAVDGSRRTIRLKDARFGPPVIILHAAERRPAGSTASITPRVTFLPTTFATTTNAFDDDPPPIELECPECEGGGGGNGGGSGGGGSPAPGIYLTTFFSHEDDGWAGDLELEFRSYAFENSVPYYLGIVDDSHFHYGTQCAKGTGTTNYQPRTWYTNQLLLVSPGVTSFSTVKCTYTSTLHGYELHVIEMDGMGGWEDDFGRRFFYAFGSGAPYNASPNTLENYYKKSGVPAGDHSQVALTLEVR